MPKRTSEEKMAHYARKIKRLEEKISRSRVGSFSDSDVEVEYPDNDPQNNIHMPLEPMQSGVEILDVPIELNNQTDQPPDLPEEYLSALGDAINDAPQYGGDIHNDLAQRWLPILRRGLPKDTKEKLLNEYLIPNNCKLLKAPTLNLEISVAVTEALRSRDKKLELAQNQLGKGIASINKAMTLLLTNDDKIQVIKTLSDASRILSDLHHYDTEQRIKLLTPNLDRSIINIIENNEDRDETLFGCNLSEKIKTAKSIEKQGLSIKKTAPIQRPQASLPGPSRRRQGNWSGPARFQSNRGGRMASRIPTMSTAPATARRAQATAPPAHTRPAHLTYSRAPLRR